MLIEENLKCNVIENMVFQNKHMPKAKLKDVLLQECLTCQGEEK